MKINSSGRTRPRLASKVRLVAVSLGGKVGKEHHVCETRTQQSQRDPRLLTDSTIQQTE